MYILVVEDDQFVSALVKFVLVKEGYEVETAENPRVAIQFIEKRLPDMMLLDVKMPYQDGFQFSEELQQDDYDIPTIFMTADDAMERKLEGFQRGADDYICKPFNYEELVVRVNALMRRINKSGKVGNQSLSSGSIELFPADLKVVVPDKEPLALTHTETQVLRILMGSANQVVSRDHLLAKVWNDEGNDSNIVDVYIRRLRKKIEVNPFKPQYILSIRGLGYKFVVK